MKLAKLSIPRLNPRWRGILAATACSLLVSAAWAQTPEYQGEPQSLSERASDPPGRVGRLSDLNGQVWLFSPDAGEWVSASRNRPLTTGDRLSTDAGARAEIRIGSTTLRLDSGSEIEVLRLDDDRVAVQLHNGSASVRLRNREAAAEFELKTGEGRFRVLRTGRYRFDRIDEASHVTVYNGQAVYEGPGSALTVNSGQRAEFWVDASNAAQYSITEPLRDAFAAWNGERDRSDDRSASSRYVSPEMTGVEDLDRHGRWEQSDDYGALWIPRVVAPGWAPYSSGHWAWVRPWGWTWVDDAPWGFAPFHYGRWVWFRSNWCWAPGTYVARPVYAPALVAWVGGPHLSVSINIGGGPAVGWFPLAPREVYVPTYHVSPRYVQNVNITHVTNITNITTIVNNPQAAVADRDFSNRKFPHAVTVVPTSVMTSRQPVAAAAAQFRDTPAVRELANQPTRSVALVAAPVTAPPVAPRGDAQAQGPRMQRPRDRESGDAPRVLIPADNNARTQQSAPVEVRGRDAARTAVTPPTAPPTAASPAPSPAPAAAVAANPPQAVPPRPRVIPNAPVAPRTDVAPLPVRPAPAQAATPQPAPQRPVPPVEAPRVRAQPPAEAPRVRVQPPPPQPVPQQAAVPEAKPRAGRGDVREEEPDLRKRQRGERPQREGPNQQAN